ncbi:MAG: glycosyltransferase family 4 protein [Pseudomonadota bacterium]
MRPAKGRAPPIAFYAPMKPPDHPTPSGDRQIAQLMLEALDRAGSKPFIASRLRTLDMMGDTLAQARLERAADAEVTRLSALHREAPPALWFTYHCYYKAPDLIGPAVARALDIPYVIAEPSIAARRRQGRWSMFCRHSEDAIIQADRLFWTTERDRPALEAVGLGNRMIELRPFLDVGEAVAPRDASKPLQLLTVAMMRPGDKTESYRRLAAALARLERPWHLTVIGDGPARETVLGWLSPLGPVEALGQIDDPKALRTAYEGADLLVWPGVGEGVGMVWIEAQAAGLPVVAERGPAARAVIGGGCFAEPDDPDTFAAAIVSAAETRKALSRQARLHAVSRHGVSAAANTLAEALLPLMRR